MIPRCCLHAPRICCLRVSLMLCCVCRSHAARVIRDTSARQRANPTIGPRRAQRRRHLTVDLRACAAPRPCRRRVRRRVRWGDQCAHDPQEREEEPDPEQPVVPLAERRQTEVDPARGVNDAQQNPEKVMSSRSLRVSAGVVMVAPGGLVRLRVGLRVLGLKWGEAV
jgi:hypothetical protein